MKGTRAIYREGDYLISHTERGRCVLCRIAEGLALGWDHRTKDEYVFGRIATIGNQMVVLIDLAPAGRTFDAQEADSDLEKPRGRGEG